METPDWEKELLDIPDRVCVAFAARCARRVQPYFKESWASAPESLCKLVERAIALAERCAVAPPGDAHSTSTFALNARTAAKAASQAGADQAAHVASTAAYATYAATAIGYANCSAAHAAECAEYAVKAASSGRESEIVGAMERDIACMRDSLANAPDDETSVIELFGPLRSGSGEVSLS